MEKSITTTINSHIFMENPVQAMYTSGMFQIFQQASQFDLFSSPGGLSLEFLGNERQITVVASLYKTESIVGLCVSVVFPLLCAYLLLQRQARISLWSKEQLQHCTVLIRALADSDMFPPCCVDLLVKHVGNSTKAVSMRDLKLAAMEFEVETGKTEPTTTFVLRQPQDEASSPHKKLKLPIKSLKESIKMHPKPPPGWLDEF
ncbi:hypothetical protein Poli38472_013392 [Pythium oligandrum]|uniref:Uncharacterized protein n=1 Tax=Pythium oligandrum TaxID=41045 RepID=A0A8K1C7N7_PYTOL|nr:hypothetical protein Poli38472_013392 [Pythium oligandrum]|eukprot:TMW57918.1 hypothetical protein Poli38472_013392 [Pythium oligandrum]